MGRNHRRPGVVRITCTDTYHTDTPEWAEHGHHYLLNLRLAGVGDRSRLTVPGIDLRTQTVPYAAPDGTLYLFWERVTPGAPVKNFRHADGSWVYRFRCSCGRNVQRSESHLIEVAARYAAAFPGRRVALDITRL